MDLGNHQINRDNSNGFMFAGRPGAAAMWPAIKSDGIEAVSSLPGGQSGVPGNQFYLNLLPTG